MAMSSVICKASFGAVPLTLRAVASPRILPSFVIKAVEHSGGDVHKKSFVISHRSNFSTVSDHALKRVDQKLVKVLKSEIKSHPLGDLVDAIPEEKLQVPEASTGLPFEMEDIPGKLSVKLKREFGGEKIEVLVYDPIYPEKWSGVNVDGGGDNPSTDSSGDDEPEKRCFSFDKPRIQLTLNITKESGRTMSIYLWANVGYVGHPEIFIKPGSRVSNEMSFDQEEYWREFMLVGNSVGYF